MIVWCLDRFTGNRFRPDPELSHLSPHFYIPLIWDGASWIKYHLLLCKLLCLKRTTIIKSCWVLQKGLLAHTPQQNQGFTDKIKSHLKDAKNYTKCHETLFLKCHESMKISKSFSITVFTVNIQSSQSRLHSIYKHIKDICWWKHVLSKTEALEKICSAVRVQANCL